ncbi:MAG: hypothetical protein ABH829_01915 [archaeon]
MNINEIVDRYKSASESEFYERIKNSLDIEKILFLYGRSVSVFELMILLQKKADSWKLQTNRDRLYSALSHRLNAQYAGGNILLQPMANFDEDLHFLIQKVVRDNGIPLYEGEFKVVSPKMLTQTSNSILRTYLKLRFTTERDFLGAFEKAESQLAKHIARATDGLRLAATDAELLTFLAAFYKDILNLEKNQAKAIYSQKAAELNLVSRMKRKYALTDEETTALRYTIYKAVKDICDHV